MGNVEIAKGLEGIRAGDIRVEDEEWGRVLTKNFFGEGERTSCEARRQGEERREMQSSNQESVQDPRPRLGHVSSAQAWERARREGLSVPVPRGSVSTEKVILMLYCSSHLLRRATMTSGRLFEGTVSHNTGELSTGGREMRTS